MPSIVESLMNFHLMEAKVDRYLPMIGIFKKHRELFPEEYEKLEDDVREIVSMFKRDDRITLLIRYRIISFVMGDVMFSQNTANDKDVLKKLVQPYKKHATYIEKIKPDIEPAHLKYHADHYVGRLYDLWPHYVGLGYQPILDFNWDRHTLDEVIFTLNQLEEDFKDAADKIIDITNDDSVDKILSFPNGGAWFDLQKPYCAIEGKAMKHCGNRGTPKDSHTVLSYRTPATKDGDPTTDDSSPYWVPHLTFIFDKETGLFTEMKGRGNGKPSKKYHSVITELMRMPFVKGIEGGGYKPENNFSVFDLSSGVVQSLITEKPDLIGPYDALMHSDMVHQYPVMMQKLVEFLGPRFDYFDNYLIVAKSGNLVEFFDNIGMSDYANAIRYLNGVDISVESLVGDSDYYVDVLKSAIKSTLTHNQEALEKLIYLGTRTKAIPDNNDFRKLSIDIYSNPYNDDSTFFKGFRAVFKQYLRDTVANYYRTQIKRIISGERKLLAISADGFVYDEDFTGYAIPVSDITPDHLSMLKNNNIFLEGMVDIHAIVSRNMDELQDLLYKFIMSLGNTNEAKIVLRGIDGDAPQQFMDALMKYTKPNPMDDNEVLYGHVTMNVYPMGDHIHLGNIMTFGDKGAGHGSDALSLLTELADEYDVEIRGRAKTYSTNPEHLDFDKLVAWYRKHGFEIGNGDSRTGVNIVYKPH